jgi:sugar lactone lactonase YvrE
MSNVRIVQRPNSDELGEGPMWSSRQNALFWVDIFRQRLNRLSLGSGEISTWDMPERIGWIVEREGRSDFIIGLKSGFAALSLEPFSIQHIGNPEPERPQNRLNDAKTDAAGRIWAGSMDDRETGEASGALYRLDPDLTWSRRDDDYVIANGPTFSPDGRTMYHTDTGRATVFAFDLNAEGELSNKRVFLKFEQDHGHPDGMTTDSEGGVWIAHWGAARISRFRPDSIFDRSISLPANNITSIVFAGPGLDRMFVTSARLRSQGEREAGSLFEVEAGVRGNRAVPFAG